MSPQDTLRLSEVALCPPAARQRIITWVNEKASGKGDAGNVLLIVGPSGSAKATCVRKAAEAQGFVVREPEAADSFVKIMDVLFGQAVSKSLTLEQGPCPPPALWLFTGVDCYPDGTPAMMTSALKKMGAYGTAFPPVVFTVTDCSTPALQSLKQHKKQVVRVFVDPVQPDAAKRALSRLAPDYPYLVTQVMSEFTGDLRQSVIRLQLEVAVEKRALVGHPRSRRADKAVFARDKLPDSLSLCASFLYGNSVIKADDLLQGLAVYPNVPGIVHENLYAGMSSDAAGCSQAALAAEAWLSMDTRYDVDGDHLQAHRFATLLGVKEARKSLPALSKFDLSFPSPAHTFRNSEAAKLKMAVAQAESTTISKESPIDFLHRMQVLAHKLGKPDDEDGEDEGPENPDRSPDPCRSRITDGLVGAKDKFYRKYGSKTSTVTAYRNKFEVKQ